MKTTIFVAFVLLFTGLAFRLGWTLSPGFTLKQEPSHQPQPNLQIVAVSDLPIVASLMGETIFDDHHKKAVKVFEQLPGFGFDRILPTVIHDFNKPMTPDQTDLFSSYDFTFIGNDAESRRRHSGEIPFSAAAFSSPRKNVSKAIKASGADLNALEKFERDPNSRRQFHLEGDSLVGYGPLRATTTCAKCHGVEEGTLLGMFRYRFDLPADLTNQDLASTY